ncbi:MAG: hypothetical protein WC855_09335 [Thermodesulfovibrionales bacterium]
MTEKTKKGKEGMDIDPGIGKLSFGGLFKGIEKLIDIAEKAWRKKVYR